MSQSYLNVTYTLENLKFPYRQESLPEPALRTIPWHSSLISTMVTFLIYMPNNIWSSTSPIWHRPIYACTRNMLKYTWLVESVIWHTKDTSHGQLRYNYVKEVTILCVLDMWKTHDSMCPWYVEDTWFYVSTIWGRHMILCVHDMWKTHDSMCPWYVKDTWFYVSMICERHMILCAHDIWKAHDFMCPWYVKDTWFYVPMIFERHMILCVPDICERQYDVSLLLGLYSKWITICEKKIRYQI